MGPVAPKALNGARPHPNTPVWPSPPKSLPCPPCPPAPLPLRLFIDADACPVKDEAYRVAARSGLKVIVVANSPILAPRAPDIERVVVAAGPDVADD